MFYCLFFDFRYDGFVFPEVFFLFQDFTLLVLVKEPHLFNQIFNFLQLL